MPPTFNINDYFGLLDVWWLDNNVIKFTRHSSGRWSSDFIILNDEDLASAHPDLPIVIRAILDHDDRRTGWMEGRIVEAHYAKLAYGLVALSDHLDEDRLFATLSRIVVTPGSDLVEIIGQEVVTAVETYQGNNYEVLGVLGTRGAAVWASSLDTAYPGWSERYTIGLGLGFDGSELARFSLSLKDKPVLAANLDNVHFDT